MILQSFNERLKEAREKIPLTQDEMAIKSGVPKRTYCAYESGEMAPSAKLLTGLACMGIDISYLLTGSRGMAPAPAPALKPDEAALLDNYRHCSVEGKNAVKTTVSCLAQQASGLKKKAG